MKTNIKKSFCPLFLLFLMLFLGFFRVLSVKAQSLGLPFGGKIVTVIPCLASANYMITHVPAAGPPVVIYQPGISRLYSYFQLTPGNWMLGNTLGMAPCLKLVPFPPFVISLGTYPLISIVGTSGVGMTSGSGVSSEGGESSGGGSGSGTNLPTSYSPTDPCGEGDVMTSSYIIANEGWKNSRYRLPGESFYTVGVGHQITGNEGMDFSQPLTNAQVQQLFNEDYAEAQEGVVLAAAANGVDLSGISETRLAVLTDMSFNMGVANLADFENMWSEIDSGDWSGAAREITNSDYGRSSLTGSRAANNAQAMSSDNRSFLDNKINSDSVASRFCEA